MATYIVAPLYKQVTWLTKTNYALLDLKFNKT